MRRYLSSEVAGELGSVEGHCTFRVLTCLLMIVEYIYYTDLVETRGPYHAHLAFEEACFDGCATVEEWTVSGGQGGTMRLQWRCVDHEKRPGREVVPLHDPDRAGKEASRHTVWWNKNQ